MPRIRYQEINFSPKRRAVIDQANAIIAEYAREGFELTLRQLYYQFVARGFSPNTEREYKRLGSIVNDGRMAGLIDWLAIGDRTRYLRSLAHWDSPADIVAGAAQQFRVDKWKDQAYRAEVWIEKDALVGVIEGVCHEMDAPFFSCRGYTSQSEMWRAARRLRGYAKKGHEPVVLHLGDHDPSGIDMSRDIQDRIRLFMGPHTPFQFVRLALNEEQVQEHDPVPNPAKVTDSRYEAYRERYGEESWELDALDPRTIEGLVRDALEELIDLSLWQEAEQEEQRGREQLATVAASWNELVEQNELEEPEEE